MKSEMFDKLFKLTITAGLHIHYSHSEGASSWQ